MRTLSGGYYPEQIPPPAWAQMSEQWESVAFIWPFSKRLPPEDRLATSELWPRFFVSDNQPILTAIIDQGQSELLQQPCSSRPRTCSPPPSRLFLSTGVLDRLSKLNLTLTLVCQREVTSSALKGREISNSANHSHPAVGSAFPT
jgi:hypothetical protein